MVLTITLYPKCQTCIVLNGGKLMNRTMNERNKLGIKLTNANTDLRQ